MNVDDALQRVTDHTVPNECLACRAPIVQPETGRTRKFCNDACRAAAYRARRGLGYLGPSKRRDGRATWGW